MKLFKRKCHLESAPAITIGSAEGQLTYVGLRNDPDSEQIRSFLDEDYKRLMGILSVEKAALESTNDHVAPDNDSKES